MYNITLLQIHIYTKLWNPFAKMVLEIKSNYLKIYLLMLLLNNVDNMRPNDFAENLLYKKLVLHARHKPCTNNTFLVILTSSEKSFYFRNEC